MDVTIDNFELVAPQIKSLCESCDFISFDEEMTGINNGDPAMRNSFEDDPAERYAKMRGVASRYSIISFGLCFFHRVVDSEGIERFEATPFNFYVFPSQGQDIVMSAASIDFLKQHKMDFNTWIQKGISYCDEKNENYMRTKYIEPLTNPAANVELLQLTRSTDVEFFDSNIARFKDFFDNTSDVVHTFDKTNAYLRKSLYLYLDKYYADTICTSTNENGQLLATRLSEENRQKILDDKMNEALAKVRKHVGFRSVINDIIYCKKPFVGHNCMFDFLFMMRSFVAPLPDSFFDLRSLLHDRFPNIYDTKYVAASGILGSKFQDTVLDKLYHNFLALTAENDEKERNKKNSATSADIANPFSPILSEMHVESSSSAASASGGGGGGGESNEVAYKPFVYCKDDFAKYIAGDAFHNAGYDAYITGSMFAMQIKYFGTNFACADINEAFSLLSAKGKNVLYLMFAMYDINFAATSGNCGVLKLEGAVFHLTVPSEKISFKEIEQTYIDSGVDKSNLCITRIDRTNCYFASLTGNVIPLDVTVPSDWTILSFSDYLAKKNGSHIQASSESKLDMDSSSSSSSTLGAEVTAEAPLALSSSSSSNSNTNTNTNTSMQVDTTKEEVTAEGTAQAGNSSSNPISWLIRKVSDGISSFVGNVDTSTSRLESDVASKRHRGN